MACESNGDINNTGQKTVSLLLYVQVLWEGGADYVRFRLLGQRSSAVQLFYSSVAGAVGEISL